MVQQQKGNTIQLADAGGAEFPEDYAEGSSQLLLSAAFLTAELALLQKSFNVKVKDTMVSCPVATPPISASASCNDSPCQTENYPGVVSNARTGRGQDGFLSSFHPTIRHLSVHVATVYSSIHSTAHTPGIYPPTYNSSALSIHLPAFFPVCLVTM